MYSFAAIKSKIISGPDMQQYLKFPTEVCIYLTVTSLIGGGARMVLMAICKNSIIDVIYDRILINFRS